MLEEYRIKMGYSITEYVKLLGIGRRTYYSYLNLESVPKGRSLKNISAVLGEDSIKVVLAYEANKRMNKKRLKGAIKINV